MTDEQWSDWIPWPGGECPIPWAKEDEWEPRVAHECILWWSDAILHGWMRTGDDCDITAYRYRIDKETKGSERP